jgi:hypothetical protein
MYVGGREAHFASLTGRQLRQSQRQCMSFRTVQLEMRIVVLAETPDRTAT